MEEYTNYLVHRDGEYDFLAHHGVKGQRWGVRRYQNDDGTLNDKGRKKLGKLQKKSSEFLSKHAKYEKKVYKATKRGNAEDLLKFKKKSSKYLKKHAKYDKKIYKIKKQVNKSIKQINKGKARANKALGVA